MGMLNRTRWGLGEWVVSLMGGGTSVMSVVVSGSDVGMVDVSVTVLEPLSWARSTVKEGDGTER